MFERLTKAAVDNPVSVHLISLLLLVGGVVMYMTMPQEIFPEFTRERIRVITIFPGASPEDVEELVSVKIEDVIDGITDVEILESTSQEGISTVVARLRNGADVPRVLQDIDRAVQGVDDLPDDAEEPLVEEVKTRFPVVTLSIYGDLDEKAMKDLTRPIRRKIESIPGVASARPTGVREQERQIRVSADRLAEFQLTIEDVARALSAQNLNVPGGKLESQAGDVLLRTRGETKTVRQIEEVVIRVEPDGSPVTVGNVATVKSGFAEPLTLGRLNGKRALNLTALKEKGGNIIDIAEAVRELDAGLDLPPGVESSIHTDMSVFLKSRLQTMQRNALQGFFLVMLSLCVLLNWRMALLVAFGIPLAFLTTFAAMGYLDMSINMMSLFAMILILGMLVDDAIIVTENIYRRIEEGEPPAVAAVKGTAEVAKPVMATILTTISAFLPMVLTPGEMGQWMYVVPVVVTLCLLASAVECFVILPVHVSEFAKPEPTRSKWYEALLVRYEVIVRKAFTYRYPLIATTVGLSIVLVAWSTTQIKFTLFGKFSSDIYFINFELPSESSLDETSRRSRALEDVALELRKTKEASSVATNLGIAAVDYNRADTGAYLGQVVVTFAPAAERERSVDELVVWLRERCEKQPGFTKVEFKGMQAGPGGQAIEVAVEGDDYAALEVASLEIQDWLRQQGGVHGVFDDAIPGKRELEVTVDVEAASSVGLTTRSVALQVRGRFQGREATTVRDVDDDVPLVVQLTKDERALRASLEDMLLTTPTGESVPLLAVAKLQEKQGLSKIVRSDRRRAITTLADVDVDTANAMEVTLKLENRFARPLKERGVDLQIKGQRREAEQSMRGLMKALLISLLLIYLILGTQFKSFSQPLFVMVAIPFGIDGILVGHILMGRDLTFLSMMGLVATSGIVVNDSLVLVDLVNRLREQGLSVYEAAVKGSVQRLRPILLTSITTIFGLSPLAFFASGQARFLAPMAISIVFGLLFATGLTLIVIPALYLIREDMVRAIFGTRQGNPESAGDADDVPVLPEVTPDPEADPPAQT